MISMCAATAETVPDESTDSANDDSDEASTSSESSSEKSGQSWTTLKNTRPMRSGAHSTRSSTIAVIVFALVLFGGLFLITTWVPLAQGGDTSASESATNPGSPPDGAPANNQSRKKSPKEPAPPSE